MANALSVKVLMVVLLSTLFVQAKLIVNNIRLIGDRHTSSNITEGFLEAIVNNIRKPALVLNKNRPFDIENSKRFCSWLGFGNVGFSTIFQGSLSYTSRIYSVKCGLNASSAEQCHWASLIKRKHPVYIHAPPVLHCHTATFERTELDIVVMRHGDETVLIGQSGQPFDTQTATALCRDLHLGNQGNSTVFYGSVTMYKRQIQNFQCPSASSNPFACIDGAIVNVNESKPIDEPPVLHCFDNDTSTKVPSASPSYNPDLSKDSSASIISGLGALNLFMYITVCYTVVFCSS